MKLSFPITVAVFTIISTSGLLSPHVFSSAFADDAVKGQSPDAVDARINELHSKLKITAAQEDLWSKISQEMRDSAKTMKDLSEARRQKATTMTAIDDLKSYSEIAETHAEDMKKFTAVFTPLYEAMNDDQKKNADTIFRTHKMDKHSKAKATKNS